MPFFFVSASDGTNVVKVCAIVSLIKELYILTGTETWQLFSRMFVTLNLFKELFYPT